MPIGIFCQESYTSAKLQLEPGDSLLLYTDGLTESCDPLEAEYGTERLSSFAGARHSLGPQALTAACLDDATLFRSGRPKGDDLTVMVIQCAA